ncbi:SDR family oxidoreductase [Hazenella coriacea]|uniref:Thioester reductase-like protein n=1 Tax=Hazenella coriacea TaxID=1179467 RepID=A0A4R3L4W7_9BACL|nr:SDR family oxidoreductase [Hazenella coriacea]TCS94821.1 thioester reductase-like protein [Hazenella coriacea]
MGSTYFFTGFPGFLATSILRQLIQSSIQVERIYVLVLPSMRRQAEKEIAKIESTTQFQRISILQGDLTQPYMNLNDEVQAILRSQVTHVFHLAAIYDLAVSKEIAYRVNVKGTNHVNQWVRSLPRLVRYVYFSTAYVSGTRSGRIFETELAMNQTFKNDYEQTKYEAELLVQELAKQAPTTIIRPGIVRGHSVTGETTKFDGPYFMLNFFDRLRFLPFIPYLGRGEAEGNFVPVDYIIEATLYLAHSEKGVGKTYHLTDPHPEPMKEVYQVVMKNYIKKEPVGTIPIPLAKGFLSIPMIRKWLRVEKEALDYFNCLAQYDCTQAQTDLKDSGIICPSFKETLTEMIQFYDKNKNDENKHIQIN